MFRFGNLPSIKRGGAFGTVPDYSDTNTMAMPWSHITIVFDLVRGLTFYKNGDLVETVGYGEDPGFPAELKSLFETSGFKAKPLVLGSPMCSSMWLESFKMGFKSLDEADVKELYAAGPKPVQLEAFAKLCGFWAPAIPDLSNIILEETLASEKAAEGQGEEEKKEGGADDDDTNANAGPDETIIRLVTMLVRVTRRAPDAADALFTPYDPNAIEPYDVPGLSGKERSRTGTAALGRGLSYGGDESSMVPISSVIRVMEHSTRQYEKVKSDSSEEAEETDGGMPYESAHPYPDNANTDFVVELPGVEGMNVWFDNKSSTETNYDYLTFYKTEAKDEYWGPNEKLSGGRGGSSKNFPTKKAPLYIPADKFYVHFQSDGSNNDWGYKFTCVEATGPPKEAVLAEWEGAEGAVVVESKHNYDDNANEFWEVSIPDANYGIEVRFDPACRTERNYDFVRFYKDSTHTETWGEDKYSGGRDGGEKNFPPLNDPILIPAKSFVVNFVSDGSNNDWGFKLVVTKQTEADDFGEGLPSGLGALRACASLLSSLSASRSEPFQTAMLADSGRGLSLLVRLLDVAKDDLVTSSYTNDALFTLASVDNLANIFTVVAGSVSATRWVMSMLAVLSSEKEWIEEVFVINESSHPHKPEDDQASPISVPLASSLQLDWDPKTKTSSSKEGGTVTITGKGENFPKRFTGDFKAFESCVVPGTQCGVNFVTGTDDPEWGYRLSVTPKYDGFELKGLQNLPILAKTIDLKLVFDGIESDDEGTQRMATRALANFMFASDSLKDKGLYEQAAKQIFSMVESDAGGGKGGALQCNFEIMNRNVAKVELQTTRIQNLQADAEKAAAHGSTKLYHEVTLKTLGTMKLGWLRVDDALEEGKSLGDQDYACAIEALDGRLRLRSGGVTQSVNRSWKEGDVIGFCLDVEASTVSYLHNGAPLGSPFALGASATAPEAELKAHLDGSRWYWVNDEASTNSSKITFKAGGSMGGSAAHFGFAKWAVAGSTVEIRDEADELKATLVFNKAVTGFCNKGHGQRGYITNPTHDVNSADAAALTEVLTSSMAEKVAAEREANGAYGSMADVAERVEGLGAVKLEHMSEAGFAVGEVQLGSPQYTFASADEAGAPTLWQLERADDAPSSWECPLVPAFAVEPGQGMQFNFGQKPFRLTPPEGYVSTMQGLRGEMPTVVFRLKKWVKIEWELLDTTKSEWRKLKLADKLQISEEDARLAAGRLHTNSIKQVARALNAIEPNEESLNMAFKIISSTEDADTRRWALRAVLSCLRANYGFDAILSNNEVVEALVIEAAKPEGGVVVSGGCVGVGWVGEGFIRRSMGPARLPACPAPRPRSPRHPRSPLLAPTPTPSTTTHHPAHPYPPELQGDGPVVPQELPHGAAGRPPREARRRRVGRPDRHRARVGPSLPVERRRRLRGRRAGRVADDDLLRPQLQDREGLRLPPVLQARQGRRGRGDLWREQILGRPRRLRAQLPDLREAAHHPGRLVPRALQVGRLERGLGLALPRPARRGRRGRRGPDREGPAPGVRRHAGRHRDRERA